MDNLHPYTAMRVGKNQLIVTLHNPDENWFEAHEEFYLVSQKMFTTRVSNWQRAFLLGALFGAVLIAFLLKIS